jgi:hypothetical protein
MYGNVCTSITKDTNVDNMTVIPFNMSVTARLITNKLDFSSRNEGVFNTITIYDATMTMINITLQNTTQPYSDGEDEIRSLTSIIFLAFIIIIFIFLAVFGNILVVMAVLKTPSLREEKSNLLVINLAVTDMLNVYVIEC